MRPCHSEQVRVARRAVDVGRQRVEPHDVGGQLGVDAGHRGRRERQRAGQEVDAEVDAGAGAEQVLDLRVGLGARQLAGSSARVTSSGTGRPSRRAELADDDLGHERARPLPGAAELGDVEPVVVGLHQPGQRPALAQGLDVARGGDVAERTGGDGHGAAF